MKYSHIMLTDKGLLALNAPLHVFSNAPLEKDSKMYQQALQQAIKEGVYFKPDGIPIEYKSELMVWMKKGEVRPIPDGYEVKVETKCKYVHSCVELEKCNECEYAILVPKEKIDHTISQTFQEEVFKQAKQQSIEEAADQYSYEFDTRYQPIAKQDFIAGAKWMEEQFKHIKSVCPNCGGNWDETIDRKICKKCLYKG